jgi:site-specific recombinase XerC
MHVAAYIEQHPGSPQTIKQHLAAIRMLFDYLVISQVVPANPAAPVKGPTHVVKRGKTPILSVEDARTLLVSIPTNSLQGLRDRARAFFVQRPATGKVCALFTGRWPTRAWNRF